MKSISHKKHSLFFVIGITVALLAVEIALVAPRVGAPSRGSFSLPSVLSMKRSEDSHATGEEKHSAKKIIDEEKIEEEADSFSFLLLQVLLIICFLTAFALRVTKFRYLQESGCAIIYGMVVGAAVRFLSNIEKLQTVMAFDRDILFLWLLPPIVFSGGFSLRQKLFFKNLGSILLLAFLGTALSAFAVGGIVYGCVRAGIMSTPLSFVESLMFGTMISATDPLTPLSIFNTVGVDPLLYSNVFGESVLNDAVAIVMFTSVVRFESDAFTALAVVEALGAFVGIFIGSTLVGVGIGMFSSLLFKYADLQQMPILETALLMTYAYSSYLLAQGLGLSGIVAILFTGIVMQHYTLRNLSKASRKNVAQMFEIIKLIAETFLFVYLGLAVFSFTQHYQAAFILVALLAIAVARLHVFPLCILANRFRSISTKLTWRHQTMLWFGGVRGAIAFTLALGRETENGDSMFTTTLMIVIITVLINGGLFVPVMTCVGVETGAAATAGGATSMLMADDAGYEGDDDDDIGTAQRRGTQTPFERFEEKYLIPIFCRRQQRRDLFSSANTVLGDRPMLPRSTAERREENDQVELEMSDSDEDNGVASDNARQRERRRRALPSFES